MRQSLVGLVLVLVVACSGSSGDEPDANTFAADPGHLYVIDSLRVLEGPQDPQSLDLDNDPEARPDNAFASLVGLLQETVDVQGAIDHHVASGSSLLLARLQAESLLTSTNVNAWVYLGDNPSVAPCEGVGDSECRHHLDGTASFDIRSGAPTDTALPGFIVGGFFKGGPGSVTIELSLIVGGTPVELPLVGARVEVLNVGDTELGMGTIAGGILARDIDAVLFPAIHEGVNTTVDEDCPNDVPPCCTPGTDGETLIDLYDDDDSCTLSADELRNNTTLSSLLGPDIDLLDCSEAQSAPDDCVFFPGLDGINDSLSFGLGFTAVTADFLVPASN
jgi:hypothetical protein